MINAGGIPVIEGDMDALAGHARAISAVGAAFAGTGEQVNATWQGLAAVYQAPEVTQLLAATGPVQHISASVGADIDTVGSVLGTYAGEVREIKARLEALRAQAGAFERSVAGDDDWADDDDAKVERNNELVGAVNAAVADFYTAQRRCANAINALYGGQQYRADDGDGQLEPGEYGHTADQLGAAGELPWGTSAEKDRGLLGDLGHWWLSYQKGFWVDGAWGMVKDLGALIGRDPVTGDWSWGMAGTAWAGVGTFALAVGTYATPGGMLLDRTVGVPGFEKGAMGDTLVGAGKSMIAYDQWGEDPARAAGNVGFNIVSAVAGTKGATSGLKGMGTAAAGSRVGAVSAAGNAMVRGAEYIGKLPTVDDVATGAARLPGFHLPDPGSTRVDVPHHVDTPTGQIDTPGTGRVPDTAPAPGSVGDALARTPDSSPPPRGDTPQGVGAAGDPPTSRGEPSHGATAAAGDPDTIPDRLTGGNELSGIPDPSSPGNHGSVPERSPGPAGASGDSSHHGPPSQHGADSSPAKPAHGGGHEADHHHQPNDNTGTTPEPGSVQDDRSPSTAAGGDYASSDSTRGDHALADGTFDSADGPAGADGTLGPEQPSLDLISNEGKADSSLPEPFHRNEPLPASKELERPFYKENDPTNSNRFFYPDTVNYMSADELEAHRLFVRDGKLYQASDGAPFDTSAATTLHSGQGRAMFVMDEHGNLYASNRQARGELHHSSFLAGRPVAGAGEIAVQDGVPKLLSRKSGHYLPSEEHQQQVRDIFAEQGIDVDGIDFTEGF